MSQMRKVKIKVDIEKIRMIAKKMEMKVFENEKLSYFSLKDRKFPYIVKGRGFEFGIDEESNIVYDDLFSNGVSEFIASYIEGQLKEKNFSYERVSDDNQIVLIIKR